MKLTNKHKLPDSIYLAIKNQIYDITKNDPNRIGVTTLIYPPIQRILKVRYWNDIVEDASNYIWLILGSAVHEILGKIDDSDKMIEEKSTQEVDGITIVCKPDIYDTKTCRLADFKITSVFAAQKASIEWEYQLNCYAWFLRKLGYEVKTLSIDALLKDWRRSDMFRYPKYPKIPFKKLSIRLWSFEEQDKYIKERVKLYKEALALPTEKLPICSPEDRWRKEDTYAVLKKGRQRAIRVLPTMNEAVDYIQASADKDKLEIEVREGRDNKCADYCSVNKFCPYYRQYLGKANQ